MHHSVIIRSVFAACLLAFSAHASRPGPSELQAQSSSSSSSYAPLAREALMHLVQPENLPTLPVDLWDNIIIPYLGTDDNPFNVLQEDVREEPVILKGHTNWITSAEFNNDNTKILTTSHDYSARIWDAISGQELLKIPDPLIVSAHFSQDGTKIITSPYVCILDALTGKKVRDFPNLRCWVRNLVKFNPDDTKFVIVGHEIGGNGNSVSIHNSDTGQELLQLIGHCGEVTSAQYHHDGTKIVTTSEDNTAHVWDTHTGQQLIKLIGDIRDSALYHFNSAQFSHDGTKIMTVGFIHNVQMWDVFSGQKICNLSDDATAGQFNRNGKHIVTGHRDNTARVSDESKCLRTLTGHTDRISSIQFSHDDTKLVTGSWDNTARIWHLYRYPKVELNQWVLLLMLEQSKKGELKQSLEDIAQQHDVSEITVQKVFATFKERDKQAIMKTFIKKLKSNKPPQTVKQCCTIQ
ncbi:MAG: WD40 repeat domain-containing protein [Candidatus Babeliales bacterium]|nr:WD40 repeat domain-containing protein [Candidatus Babeliales bacterium]